MSIRESYDSWSGRLFRIDFVNDGLVGVIVSHGMSVDTARGFARYDRPMGFERLPATYEARDMMYEMNGDTPILYTNCSDADMFRLRKLQRADEALRMWEDDEL